MTITAELFGKVISTALRSAMDNEPRSLQAQQGTLGPSDVGFCRNKATLIQKQVTPSDSSRIMPMILGSALHRELLGTLAKMFPSWIVEGAPVTAVLPNGRRITGTPDIIIPEWNCVGDLKGVDGFSWVKRTGVSQNYAFQRHLYTLGAIQAGYISREKPIMLAEIYVDRSGETDDILVLLDEPDWEMTNQITSWLDEVDRAASNGSDAPRDIPAPVCERICEFYTRCRGGLPFKEEQYEIEDPNLIDAVAMFNEGREKESEGKRLKNAARLELAGVNGFTKDHTVRWTEIKESSVEYKREGYLRLDIRKRRK